MDFDNLLKNPYVIVGGVLILVFILYSSNSSSNATTSSASNNRGVVDLNSQQIADSTNLGLASYTTQQNLAEISAASSNFSTSTNATANIAIAAMNNATNINNTSSNLTAAALSSIAGVINNSTTNSTYLALEDMKVKQNQDSIAGNLALQAGTYAFYNSDQQVGLDYAQINSGNYKSLLSSNTAITTNAASNNAQIQLAQIAGSSGVNSTGAQIADVLGGIGNAASGIEGGGGNNVNYGSSGTSSSGNSDDSDTSDVGGGLAGFL